MALVDELERLAALHERGQLSADEFAQAKARLVQTDSGAATQLLRRSLDDRWIGGVCGGLARITDMESWAWRLIFSALFFFGGTGVLLYILLWFFVPNE